MREISPCQKNLNYIVPALLFVLAVVVSHTTPAELADDWYDAIAYGLQYQDFSGGLNLAVGHLQATIFDYFVLHIWRLTPDGFYALSRAVLVFILGFAFVLSNPGKKPLIALLLLPLAFVDGVTTPTQMYGALFGGLMVIALRRKGLVALVAAVALSFALSSSYASWWVWLVFSFFAMKANMRQRLLLIAPVFLAGLCGPASQLLLVGADNLPDIWRLSSDNSLMPMLLGLYEPSFYQHKATAALLIAVMFLLVLSRGRVSAANRWMIFYAVVITLATNAGAAVLALSVMFSASEVFENVDWSFDSDRSLYSRLLYFSFSIFAGTLVGLHTGKPVYNYTSELLDARQMIVKAAGAQGADLNMRSLFVPISHSGVARLLGLTPGYYRRMVYRSDLSIGLLGDVEKYDLINQFKDEAEKELRRNSSAALLPEFNPLAGLLRENYHWFDLLKVELPARPLSRPRQASALFLLLPPEAKGQFGS